MNRRAVLLVLVALVGTGALAASAAGSPGRASTTTSSEPAADTFPHRDHQGLFPLCAGCHEGIEVGDRATSFPEPGSCDGCHDGVDARVVEWTPPEPETGLLDFTHPTHARVVAEEGDPAVTCAECHVLPDGGRMEVVPIAAARCFTCHEDAAPTSERAHYAAGVDCTQCHRAAADAPAAEAKLGSWPLPSEHEAVDFLSTHAPGGPDDEARCATCHVQERCTSCHVDPSLPEIRRIPAAPAGWTLPVMEAAYPTPASHATPFFERDHGRPAPEPADCSTCHTRDDCAACHLAPLPPSAEGLPARPGSATARIGGGSELPTSMLSHAVAAAPAPSPAMTRAAALRHDTVEVRHSVRARERAPGVGLASGLPASHDTPFFMTSHPTVAAAAPTSCTSCHTESWCASCHDAPAAPGFHPANFATRHSAQATSMGSECSNCHETAAFCRSCHVEMGFGSEGRLGGGFHDAEPIWLIRHGQAARQDLETCASCHTQRNCLQCHSQLGAFKVSPHGPDFDAGAARARNPWICTACHIGTPGGA